LFTLALVSGLDNPSVFGFGFPTSTLIFFLGLIASVIAGAVLFTDKNEAKSLTFVSIVGIGVFGVANICFSVFDVSSAVPHTDANFSTFLLFGVGTILTASFIGEKTISRNELVISLVCNFIFFVHILFSQSSELMLFSGVIALIVLAASFVNRSGLTEVIQLKNIFVLTLGALLFVASFTPHILSTKMDAIFSVPAQEIRPSMIATAHVIFSEFNREPRTLLLGSGLNSFGNVWNMHMPKEISATRFWNEDFLFGNSFFTTSIVEIGLPATLLLFFVGLLAVPLIFVRRFNSTVVSPSARGLAGTLTFAIAWALWYTPASFFFIIVAFYGGVLFSIVNFGTKRKGGPAKFKWHTLVLTIVGLMLMIISVTSLLALHAYGKGVMHLKKNPPEYNETTRYFGKSLFFMEFSETLRSLSLVYTEKGKAVLAGEYATEELNVIENSANLSVTSADAARAKEVNDYRTHLSLANALLFSAVVKDDTSNVVGSLESFNNAIARAPTRVLPLMGKAHALLRLGRKDEVAVILEKVLELRPSYEPALELLKDTEQ